MAIIDTLFMTKTASNEIVKGDISAIDYVSILLDRHACI